MLPAGTRLMSADDHMIEPAHLWVDRVPARYRDSCPRIVEVDGSPGLALRGRAHVHPDGVVPRRCPGFDEAGYPPAPGTARFDEIRPGCYDPVERIKDMDIDGVWGQLCFPNYARFAGHRFFLGVEDHELGLACLRTYNDFLLDEWCATDRARLFGAAILPLTTSTPPWPSCERVRRQGRQRRRVLREPDGPRAAVGAHEPLGPAVGGRRTRRGSPCACTSAAPRGS